MPQTEDYDSREAIKQQEHMNTEEKEVLFGYKCPWQ